VTAAPAIPGDEERRRPTPWRRILPWAVTALIFAAIFTRIPFSAVGAALGRARMVPYLALMAPYSVAYFLIDGFCVQRVMCWFVHPIAYRDILPVRAVTYLLSILNTQLGQGGIALYLHRRHRVPFWQVTGAIVFLAFVEFYQLALYSGLGMLVTGSAVSAAFRSVYVALLAYLVVHLAAFSRWRESDGSLPGAGLARLLTAFRRARPSHYGRLLLYKSPNLAMAIVVHYFALRLFGLAIPFLDLLTFLPIIFFVAALPITVAHLGTSQAAWIYFFGGRAPAADILAYSLTSHVVFMLVNGTIGLVFLRRAARELFADPDAASAK
jgi:hypothetical protein